MKPTDDRCTDSCRSASNGHRIIENKIAIHVGVCYGDRIRVDRRDNVGSWGKVLGGGQNSCEYESEQGDNPAESSGMPSTFVFPSQTSLNYIRLMMTAVRSSCCFVPSENLTTA